jgi:transketolase
MIGAERAIALASQLRVDSLRCSTAAGSGHPTSSLSAADLMAVLVTEFLRWSPKAGLNDDHIVFSKGHASPLLYSMWKAMGVISDEELMTYRRLGSRLQGHPVPILRGVDVATGSLGQGLPVAVGIALSGKYLENLPYRVWCLVGDSEMSEGSIWEAFDHARQYKLGNLIAVLDMNRLGQRGETPLGWNGPVYAERARAFGWRAIEIDGHDVTQISAAYRDATKDQHETPTLIIARTIKGKGVPAIENQNGWHGKALGRAECDAAVARLGGVKNELYIPHRPESDQPAAMPTPRAPELPRYELGKEIATRLAYGEALRAIGAARADLVVLDGEVGNSTYAEDFAKAFPERYFEMFIAEQQMVAAAVGIAARKRVCFASTFAAFLTRAYDFIRMAAVSRADLRLCGSHAGVSIGEDGPSQMGIEDLAMMRAVNGSTVLYPCCANQTAKLVNAMCERKGIVYMRTTREKTPVLYDASEAFPIGGSRVLRQSKTDVVTIIAAGITVHEALSAAEKLKASGISARVVDAYSVKPIDADTIRTCVRATRGNVVVVEDHLLEGGLGEAVLSCLADEDAVHARVARLGVHTLPGSGTPEELRHECGIDASAIVQAARHLLMGGPKKASAKTGNGERHAARK